MPAKSKSTRSPRQPGESYAAAVSTRRGNSNARQDRSAAQGATSRQRTSGK